MPLLVLLALKQRMAVEGACAFAGEDAAGQQELGWVRCFLGPFIDINQVTWELCPAENVQLLPRYLS